MKHKCYPTKLFLGTYYDVWFENEETSDATGKSDKEKLYDSTRKSDKKEYVDLSDMPPGEGDEEVKEGKVLKILTPNKLLATLPILLTKIKAGKQFTKIKK